MKISLILARSKNGVIGKNNQLPWNTLPADMQFFAQTTMGHCILTGRKTYQSIPLPYRPLKNRTNIILTRNLQFKEKGCVIVHHLAESIQFAKAQGEEELMIIGGAEIFQMALTQNIVDQIYVTQLDENLEGDVFFQMPDAKLWEIKLLFRQEKDAKHFYGFSVFLWKKL